MSKLSKKYVVVLFLALMLFSSCRSKKTFNGTATLPCADHGVSASGKEGDKNVTKWRLVLYKDGKKVGGKSKRGKSRLFKK